MGRTQLPLQQKEPQFLKKIEIWFTKMKGHVAVVCHLRCLLQQAPLCWSAEPFLPRISLLSVLLLESRLFYFLGSFFIFPLKTVFIVLRRLAIIHLDTWNSNYSSLVASEPGKVMVHASRTVFQASCTCFVSLWNGVPYCCFVDREAEQCWVS